LRSFSDVAASQLTSAPAVTVAGKCRSHLLQASDFDPQVLASRKFHPIVCNSTPSIPNNGILRLLRVSPTFLGFAAELICLEVRNRAAPLRRHNTTPIRIDCSKLKRGWNFPSH
jgi:hypothetical protein